MIITSLYGELILHLKKKIILLKEILEKLGLYENINEAILYSISLIPGLTPFLV